MRFQLPPAVIAVIVICSVLLLVLVGLVGRYDMLAYPAAACGWWVLETALDDPDRPRDPVVIVDALTLRHRPGVAALLTRGHRPRRPTFLSSA